MEKRQYLETKLRQEMEREGYDAVIAVSPENVQHLAGTFIASQRMIPDRLAFAVYRRQGGPFFVVSTVVAYTARTRSWIEEVVTYQEHAVRPIDGLAKALEEHGLGKGRVLVELGYLPTRDGDRACGHLQPGLVPPRQPAQLSREVAGIGETLQEADSKDIVNGRRVQFDHTSAIQAQPAGHRFEVRPIVKDGNLNKPALDRDVSPGL